MAIQILILKKKNCRKAIAKDESFVSMLKIQQIKMSFLQKVTKGVGVTKGKVIKVKREVKDVVKQDQI